MNQDLTDEDLDRLNWFEVRDVLFLPVDMYERPKRIELRILTGVNPVN